MDSVKTENLYEDLHWIILIAGYVLSDEVSGEKSLVPDEIMMYSIAESENVHLDSTVKYLTSLGTADIGKARRFCSRERPKYNLIGWRQRLTSSPTNHIHFLLVRA